HICICTARLHVTVANWDISRCSPVTTSDSWRRCVGGTNKSRLRLDEHSHRVTPSTLMRSHAMPGDAKRHSLTTTGGVGRAPNRAMLRGVGFLDDDFDRPMIGVASLFSDITPCNAHLDRLARKGCEGIRAAGGVPQIFGAPTASDGIMMGHQGMRYSLVSPEVIPDG